MNKPTIACPEARGHAGNLGALFAAHADPVINTRLNTTVFTARCCFIALLL